MSSFRELPAYPEGADAAPQPDGLQNPYYDRNHHHYVQNRFDARSHWNITIDQPQQHSNDD